MKKNLSVLLFLFILMFSSIGCEREKEEKKDSNVYSFYQEQKKERYDAYQKKYPNLSLKDVIIRVNIGLDYPYYSHVKKSSFKDPTLLLVNKYYYLGEDYVPEHLEEIDNTYSKGGISLQSKARESFEKMAQKAKEEGIIIRAISAYRSYNYQVNLYDRYVRLDGVENADTYSARPGFSEHQTGLCVDIDDGVLDYNRFEESKSFKWMQENAYLYGFILRYPKDRENITGYQYEAWHYRYVGEKVAEFIQKNDITYDEYYMEFLDKE